MAIGTLLLAAAAGKWLKHQQSQSDAEFNYGMKQMVNNQAFEQKQYQQQVATRATNLEKDAMWKGGLTTSGQIVGDIDDSQLTNMARIARNSGVAYDTFFKDPANVQRAINTSKTNNILLNDPAIPTKLTTEEMRIRAEAYGNTDSPLENIRDGAENLIDVAEWAGSNLSGWFGGDGEVDFGYETREEEIEIARKIANDPKIDNQILKKLSKVKYSALGGEELNDKREIIGSPKLMTDGSSYVDVKVTNAQTSEETVEQVKLKGSLGSNSLELAKLKESVRKGDISQHQYDLAVKRYNQKEKELGQKRKEWNAYEKKERKEEIKTYINASMYDQKNFPLLNQMKGEGDEGKAYAEQFAADMGRTMRALEAQGFKGEFSQLARKSYNILEKDWEHRTGFWVVDELGKKEAVVTAEGVVADAPQTAVESLRGTLPTVKDVKAVTKVGDTIAGTSYVLEKGDMVRANNGRLVPLAVFMKHLNTFQQKEG